MRVTFDVLRQKEIETMEYNQFWHVQTSKKELLSVATNDGQYEFQYHRCDELTDKINAVRNENCLLYRKKHFTTGKLFRDQFDLICHSGEDLVLGVLTVEGFVGSSIMDWYQLNEKWHQMGLLRSCKILDSYEQDLLAMIDE